MGSAGTDPLEGRRPDPTRPIETVHAAKPCQGTGRGRDPPVGVPERVALHGMQLARFDPVVLPVIRRDAELVRRMQPDPHRQAAELAAEQAAPLERHVAEPAVVRKLDPGETCVGEQAPEGQGHPVGAPVLRKMEGPERDVVVRGETGEQLGHRHARRPGEHAPRIHPELLRCGFRDVEQQHRRPARVFERQRALLDQPPDSSRRPRKDLGAHEADRRRCHSRGAQPWAIACGQVTRLPGTPLRSAPPPECTRDRTRHRPGESALGPQSPDVRIPR